MPRESLTDSLAVLIVALVLLLSLVLALPQFCYDAWEGRWED